MHTLLRKTRASAPGDLPTKIKIKIRIRIRIRTRKLQVLYSYLPLPSSSIKESEERVILRKWIDVRDEMVGSSGDSGWPPKPTTTVCPESAVASDGEPQG